MRGDDFRNAQMKFASAADFSKASVTVQFANIEFLRPAHTIIPGRAGKACNG